MSEAVDRPRILRAIKKCLSNSYDYFQEAMDILDEIGRGSIGVGMTPLVGGYAMKDPKHYYRQALIKIDSAERAMKPLTRRIGDGRVNDSHFSDDDALTLIEEIENFSYDMVIKLLSEAKGRESVWYMLRELCTKIERVYDMVAET